MNEPIDLAAWKQQYPDKYGYGYVAVIQQLIAAIEQKDAALRAVLDEPFGCPYCDSGRLRSGRTEHFDDCTFVLVRAPPSP